jgi:branched-chain amino acid transport system substrate-binding protein
MRFSLAILMFGSVVLPLAGCNNGATPPPIIVGHVSDKTRRDQAGDEAEGGIRLALHNLSKDGALAEAFQGRKIIVQHTDTRGELDAFESESVRLTTISRAVALLGGMSAKEVTALDHVKVPILTFHGHAVPGASNQVFYLGMTPTRQGDVLARTVAESAKRIIIVQDERRAEANPLAEAFQKTLADTRKEAATEPPTIVTLRFGKEPSWSEILDRMVMAPPQAVVFAGTPQDFNAWLRVARRYLSLDEIHLVFAGNDGEHQLFDLGDDAKTSVHLATAFYADPASDKIQTFLKAYRDMPPKIEADVNAALAYDGFRMLVEAMKNAAPQVTPERIRDELAKTEKFDGLTGPLTITTERQVQRPLFVMRWQNGTLTLVKAFP